MQDPGRYDMTVYQGATFDRVLTWKVGSPAVAVNLTGYTARMQLRTSHAASTSVLDLNTSNGRITLGGAAGTITLGIPAVETAALPANQYAYDLELVAGNGQVTRLLEGFITVDAEVTR
jgi:hypothetical protein